MTLETARAVRIHHAVDGTARIGSGILVGLRWVLTAAHCVDGSAHEVGFLDGSRWPATVYVVSEDPRVDLAVLLLHEDAPSLPGPSLAAARVDRSVAVKIEGCVALGFPRWKCGADGRRRLVQLDGYLPTGEGLGADGDLLELKGTGPALRDNPTEEGVLQSGPWGGMSGAGVVRGGRVLGVVRSHNLAAGTASLTITPVAAVAGLPAATRGRFEDVLGGPLRTWPVLSDPIRHSSSGTQEAGQVRPPARVIAGARPRLAAGFVARDEMERLKTVLDGGKIAALCALEGMRGVGKSQLAAAFAEHCEDSGWPFVVWITAPTKTQAINEMADIARHAGITAEEDPDRAAEELRGWLNQSKQGDRLLVFDNVEDADDVATLLPHGPGMRVIVTTAKRVTTLGVPVEVGVYSTQQAIDYLIDATGRNDSNGAAAVAEDVGRLPLALTQAASAIDLLNCDFDRYRQLLAERELDDVVEREEGSAYPVKVGAALRIAYAAVADHLADIGAEESELAKLVLWAMSLLAETGVPRDWLYSMTADELMGRKVVGELVRRSVLVESEDAATVALHRLFAKVIREDLPPDRYADAIQAAVAMLGRVDVAAPTDYSARRLLVSELGAQLIALRHQQHSQVLLGDPDIFDVAVKVAAYADRLNDPNTAIALAGFVDDCERVVGPDHPQTLNLRILLAGAYSSAGYSHSSIALLEQVLADCERILGSTDLLTLGAQSYLAGAYRLAGDLHRSILLFERTVADCERIFGADHPDIMLQRNNLAAAYSSAGDLDRAIALLERTVADCERILGADHPHTMVSRNNLAAAFITSGELHRAIPLLDHALAHCERILGPDDPETMGTRNNLAAAYAKAGDQDRAIALLERTVADCERILGADQPQTMVARNNLAAAYKSAGDPDRTHPSA